MSEKGSPEPFFTAPFLAARAETLPKGKRSTSEMMTAVLRRQLKCYSISRTLNKEFHPRRKYLRPPCEGAKAEADEDRMRPMQTERNIVIKLG